MFTVIIAEKEHIKKIEEYELFLRPFLASGNVGFCPWNLDEDRLADMVPNLADLVGRRKEWRAVIVCDEKGLEEQNPFDLVTYLPEQFTGQGPNCIYSEEYKDFLKREHEKKLLAYEEAAHNPLTRLVTFFCNTPIVTKEEDSALASSDPEYLRYVVEHRRKTELRKQILSDELTETSQPTEVICLAKRTYMSTEKDFDVAWSSHTEIEYSRFYDRNMYFDKMRYLVFDILPKTQRNYMFDYIRFLYATILLASNDIPKGCLSSERVYRLECENDEKALSVLLQTYEAKLNLTKELLNQEIQQILSTPPRVLTDREAEQIFCVKINQPVVFGEDYSEEGLYANTSEIGLSDGCPQDEMILWEKEYKKSQKELANMLKQSRRALKRTTVAAQYEQEVKFDRVELLNEFQLEDIQEHIDKNEIEMLKTELIDLYDEELFMQQMEESNRNVREKINDRMDKRTTIGLGCIASVAFVLGFFTIFFKNTTSNVFNFTTSLMIVGLAVAVFALVAIITLIFLRKSLTSRIKDFNDTMHGISGQVHGVTEKYSKYLSHMCNVRRGYQILNIVAQKHNPNMDKVVLYKKHIADIDRAKEKVKDVFGQYMVNNAHVALEELFPYDFNFSLPTEFQYELPYTEGTARKITFIQAGVYVTVPVEFVKQITIRREELYE